MKYGFENQDQQAQAEEDSFLFRQQTLEESLASLYKPPYSRSERSVPTEAPEFPGNQSSLLSSMASEPTAMPQQEPAAEPTQKNDLWSLLTMSAGGMLLTLGLLLFFFSDNGVVTLEWNANKWFLYCLASLPMIYFGLKLAKSETESP